MVKQKMRAWIRGKKRSRLQKKLDISEQQADELLSILLPGLHARQRLKIGDTQALGKILSKYEFEPAAFESMVDSRLQEIKVMLDAKVQTFIVFVEGLNQSQRIALSEMMASSEHGRRRRFCA